MMNTFKHALKSRYLQIRFAYVCWCGSLCFVLMTIMSPPLKIKKIQSRLVKRSMLILLREVLTMKIHALRMWTDEYYHTPQRNICRMKISIIFTST